MTIRKMKMTLKELKKSIDLVGFMVKNYRKQQFTCPVCNYTGPFEDLDRASGYRKHAKCPHCNALERHRLQYLVIQQVLKGVNTHDMTMLHFAPEEFFRGIFSKRFGKYETADLYSTNVDYKIDMQDLPFANASWGVVFASHVLEHIPDDITAIREIHRILRPGGMAILPVPIYGDRTIEFPEPNAYEHGHVRAPGLDYFDRYAQVFPKIEKYTSESLPREFQLFVCEDRSQWPPVEIPLLVPMEGEKHVDCVPVCYK